MLFALAELNAFNCHVTFDTFPNQLHFQDVVLPGARPSVLICHAINGLNINRSV